MEESALRGHRLGRVRHRGDVAQRCRPHEDGDRVLVGGKLLFRVGKGMHELDFRMGDTEVVESHLMQEVGVEILETRGRFLRELIFDAGHLVWAVSRVMTLHPGDIISTGTPSGIGPLRPGDVVEVEVEGIGILRNPVGTRARAEER